MNLQIHVFLLSIYCRHSFFSPLSRGKCEKYRKEFCNARSHSTFKNCTQKNDISFDIEVSTSTTNLSTLSDLSNDQSEHQNLVSWNGGIKGMPPGSVTRSPYLLPTWLMILFFVPFPTKGAWSQAMLHQNDGLVHLTVMKSVYMSFFFPFL